MTKIIAVTACPSGVAHTYMAAEALESAAKEGVTVQLYILFKIFMAILIVFEA